MRFANNFLRAKYDFLLKKYKLFLNKIFTQLNDTKRYAKFIIINYYNFFNSVNDDIV